LTFLPSDGPGQSLVAHKHGKNQLRKGERQAPVLIDRLLPGWWVLEGNFQVTA
jgi:hypothetical protein